MIEGTVDVQGTVKVDNSAFVEKYLANARRAYTKEDWEEVEKYYNMVEQNAPNNIEAVFFSAYGKAMLSMTDSEYFKRDQKFNVFKKSISVISDHYAVTTEDKQEVLTNIAVAIKKMSTITFVYNVNLSSGVGSKVWQLALIRSATKVFVNELKEIYSQYPEEYLVELIAMFEPKPKAKVAIAPLIMSIISFYCSLLGFVTCGVGSIPAIVLGVIASVKASKSGNFKGVALAAVIVSVITLILGIALGIVLYF